MKELEENTIKQVRNLLNYLEQKDLLKNKDILRRCWRSKRRIYIKDDWNES